MGKSRTPDEDLAPLARELRRMREETGLSVREFARQAGFDMHTTYAYYKGADFTGDEIKKMPRERIARALLARGIARDRVAALGRLPEGTDPAMEAIADLRKDVAELQSRLSVREKAS